MSERCAICGCLVRRGRGYATPTLAGRSHATRHHYVAERFFGRSSNRRGTMRKPIFQRCPWGVEGETAIFCYECHEELLHNPVLLPRDVEALACLVKSRGLDEGRKMVSRKKLAGRIELLNEVIAAGLERLAEPRLVASAEDAAAEG